MVGRRSSGDDTDAHDLGVGDVAARVREALLIARSAAVVTVANRIIVRALAEDATYDRGTVAAAVRFELTRLAKEQSDEADRMSDERERAKRLRARPRRPLEYTRRDLKPLSARRRIYLDVASRLRALRDDDDYVDGIVASARDRAWRDVSAAVRARLGPPPVARDELSSSERSAALNALVSEDLAALAAESGAER